MTSGLIEKLGPVKARYEELASLMGSPDISSEEIVKYSTEYSEMTPVIEILEKYQGALSEIEDLQSLLDDPEMKSIAEEDLRRLNSEVPVLEEKIKHALIPKDEADKKNAILEIRAGTGGDEAALFVSDLFTMYRGFASKNSWKLEVVEASESDIGGYKEIIAEVRGTNVFEKLKFESGVHRVQRVPKTESGGRIHTSAATVAVLPEAEEVDLNIRTEDLRIDTYRSQGAGGQHVNTTDSAVRITHLPTGVVVAMQEEKSQHKNKDKAMKILRSRIYEMERQKLADERAANRKSQVGSGDRSERIRTYNYPQGRVTDHRVNLTLYKLDEVLAGEALHEVVDQLTAEDQAEKLAEMNL
jgi:peptide chain release factor 1